MSLELVNTLATLATFLVIAATAIAAIIQLRHARCSNQIAALTELREISIKQELRVALHFIRRERCPKNSYGKLNRGFDGCAKLSCPRILELIEKHLRLYLGKIDQILHESHLSDLSSSLRGSSVLKIGPSYISLQRATSAG